MAGSKIDLNKEISLGGKSRGKMPSKTSINLVPKKESILSSKKAIPAIIGGALILVLLVGLLVVWPLIQLSRATSEVTRLSEELTEANKTIKELGYIEDEYAHYTIEGMTEEELTRADRVKVMKLVEDAVVNSGVVKSWNLSGNIMSLEVRGASLAELNQIAGALEEEPIVERCVISTANKGAGSTDASGVAVSFIVYLNSEDYADKTDAVKTDSSSKLVDDVKSIAKSGEGADQ